jgi:hypothetical protein
MGMHWGRRKNSIKSGGQQGGDLNSVTLYSKAGHGVVKTTGGHGRLPSEDAKNAAVYKQIAKKSGTDALSNDHLRMLVGRMGLEQQYSKISNQEMPKSKGRKFIEGILKSEGSALAKGSKGPLVKVVSELLGPNGRKTIVKGVDAGIAAKGAKAALKYAGSHRTN